MNKPCRPIIKLSDDTVIDLNGKSKEEIKQLLQSSPQFFKYYQRYLQEIEVIDKELDRSVVHDPVLMTGNKYTSEADKKKALSEQKESKPVFVHTVDKFYFNSGNKLETVEVDDNNQDAPTVKLHKEGMDYVNSPFFKPGTAIFYGFSNAVPYNKRVPKEGKVEIGRLSALVFTDKFDNALSAEEVQIKEKNLPELVKNGEVKIKWVGSLYEYNDDKYKDEASSLSYKSTQILTNRFRARRYKEKLLQKPAIALPGFNLHLDTHIYEQMHETVGFNENIDFIQPDPNGPIKELLKNVTSLTYIYGYPKVGIFTGFQKGTDGYPTQMQIPALDGKTIPISHSVFKNFKNLVKATGRAYLLVPTSINNAIEDNQGNKYALSRLVTKALNYDANPNDTSDASTIILTIMNSMMAKVLDGSINYDIDRSDPKEPIIINYKDNSVRKVSKVKIHDDGSIKMLVDLFKNTQLYQDYKAQETEEVTDYKFFEYLKEVDPEIPGIYKYASLYSNELVWMPEYLRQVLGMQVVKQDDLISILQLWKNMQQEGIPRAEAWQKFLREWGAAGKPIQVDVGQLANPLYWERWLKPYALLKTGLNVDRPTHSVSFYTSPVEKQEKTFNEDNTVGSNPFELFNDLNQNVYSSTFDDGPKMTKEEVIAWVNRNFPNVKKLNFYEGLIDELYNGAYNKVSDDIRYAEEFMTLGVIREEFGHKVFNSLPENQKQDLLKEARKLRPDVTDDIALEEIIMKQLRESPNSVRPKTFLSQFLTKLKQLLESIFKKRLDIEEFISRFDAGYYKSIKDKNINNPDLREKVSVLTSKLSKQSLKKYSDIVNRYVLQKYVGQSDLISIIDEQQKFLDTNVNGALKFIYNKVLPLYIEKEQEYAKEKIFAEYPALAEGFTFEKLQNSVGLFKPGTEAYYYAMYYAEFEIAKKLLEEPLFQVQLYKDLKETYGIEIRGTIEDAEKDKLGIVKAKDIKLSEEVSPSLKYLLAMIPDVSWIEDAAFKANRNKLSKETGMIAAKTAIEAIPGVVYKNTLYNNKIDDKSIPTNKIYSYDFTVNQRIASLGSVLSDSMTPRELITKLNDLYDNGDDWQRVFAFKILEEFEIMGNASPLIKDLWRGIGQKSFIPVFASYDKEGDKKTYSLNVVNTKDRLLTGFLKSAKYFGMSGNQVISITDPVKERALKERLQTINKKIQERPSKAKEVSLLVEGFSLLNIYVTKKDLNKISGNNKRDTLRDIFKRIVRDIAFPNDKLNVGLGLMFQNIGLPDAKGPLNDLAQLISLSNEKSKVLTYNDMNNETRNSYSKPNMLLTHLRRLFRDKDYAALVRTYTGYEHNPLLKAFQQALTSGTNPFDLFVYMGDSATNTNYDDMTTAQRNAFHMNNAAQGAKNDTNKWGYFSLGNWGDSPTDYSLKAPILGKATILSNFVDLIRAEVEVLLSGAEKYDSTFADNFKKGIYNFDVNDLVFGNIERIPANLNLVLANINANEDAIKKVITEDLAKRQEKFIQDLKDQDVYNASKLHSYYHKDESTYDQFSNVTEIEISPSKVSVYFWNNNYYQMASNQLLISHPHFFKDSNTYAKRAKLLHTSGDIPWDVYDENTQLKTKLRYITLEDKVTAVDQEVLDLISEKAFSNTKEASLKDFTENKGTDSGAFMSMDMLKMRNNEGKGWNYYDEQYYRAQMDLDVENIMRYQSKVSWNPLKLGAYSLREEIGETGKLVIIPTIQKYAFQILLPSEIYKLKDGTLIHPDKVEGKTLREKYAKYQNPELVKLLHSNFEKGVHFGYYGSGGKSGIIDLHDLSKDAAPKINQMPITDIKEVTKQPNKNDTKSRVLGIQARMIQYGMIEDTDSFTISNYGTISGARAKELLEEAYANDIYDKLKEIGFLAKDFYNNYQVKKEELSTYIKDYLMSKDYINPQQIRALDLSPDKKDFAVPLSLGNRPGAAMSIVNAAVNEVLQIEVNAPAYKNITRTGDLKTFVSTENGQKGMVMEAKVNMWPALERYYHKKLRENNIADKDQVGQERIKKEIIDEINATGFKMTYYRIPTEFGYSFMRIKIKDLGPASLGNGIELPDSFTTQTGGDLDGDAVFGLISSLQFGDSITLVPADTTSKGGRQTLINEIMDATLHAHPEYQLISSENNTFNDITKAIPVKQSKIGTLEANIEAQESNDLGDSLIGPLAVENSAIWYLHGLRDKLNLSTVRKHPAFDKAYSNNLLEYMVEGDLTKMAQSTTLVGGAVNNPKDGGFTKLGFDKKTGSLLGYMTSVMTVPMDYAIAFLRHPVIKEYRKAVSKIGTFASNPNYNSDLNKIKKAMYGNKFASEEDVNRIITKEELNSNSPEIRKAILGKYIELSTISGNIVKLYLALGQLKKPNDGNPENLFALYEDLQVLPKHFVGIEKLLPQIVLNTKSGNTVFEKKNPSIANDLNASYQAIIAKMSIARETSYFFHEKFKNFWNWSKANIWGLQAKDAVELENLFFRYMLSRQFKPLLEYMHLGEIVHTPEQANDMVTRQQFSLQFMQNKLYSLINTEGLDSKEDLMKMIYTLSFLDNAKNPINYRADGGTIKRNYYVKMATSIYDEEDIQSFNEGFMAMLNSKDPQIKKFAKDLRDFTVFTGWDKKDNNFGGYLPREAWLVDYVDYNQGMKAAYDNIDGELFLRTVTLYNPKRYSPQIFNTPFTMDGKKYWPFKYIKNSAPAQLTGENRYVTDKELGGKIAIPMKFYIDKELNEEYLIDKELEIGPRYIHERQGDYVGLYKRLPDSRTKYTLLSVSKDSQIMDSSPNSILALTLDDVHEELPDQGITIDPINPEIEEQPNEMISMNQVLLDYSGGAQKLFGSNLGIASYGNYMFIFTANADVIKKLGPTSSFYCYASKQVLIKATRIRQEVWGI
jgi:hypothetical protein